MLVGLIRTERSCGSTIVFSEVFIYAKPSLELLTIDELLETSTKSCALGNWLSSGVGIHPSLK
jgi:hypothetical protein